MKLSAAVAGLSLSSLYLFSSGYELLPAACIELLFLLFCLSLHLFSLTRELSRCKSRCSAWEQQLQTANTDLKKAKDRCGSLLAQNTQLETEMSKLETAHGKEVEERRVLLKKVSVSSREIADLKNAQSDNLGQIEALVRSNFALSARTSILEGDKSALRPLSYTDLSRTEDTLHNTLELIRQRKEEEIAKRMASKDVSLCVVCCEGKLEVLFRPCNHLCCCCECAGKMKECPICRGQIGTKEKVFMQS